MISFIGNRPVIQIGKRQVVNYDTQWIRDSLVRGAAAADREDFPFLDDLLNGIQHYLENKCALRVLSVEALHSRICKMLNGIGFQSIAESLPLLAPPITLSLSDLAKEAGNGFELAFFNNLHEEIEDLRLHGAETLHFTHTEECVKTLCQTSQWTPKCKKLNQEIINFLETHAVSAENKTIPV